MRREGEREEREREREEREREGDGRRERYTKPKSIYVLRYGGGSKFPFLDPRFLQIKKFACLLL